MRLKLDRPLGLITTSQDIPLRYANVKLPDHDPVVVEGDFGIMISQWLYEPEYTLCAEFYDFNEPSVVSMEVSEPCTTFCYGIEGEPIILRRLGPMIEQIVVKKGKIAGLEFPQASSGHTMLFEKDMYIFLHLTVTWEFQYLLEDPNWIIERLRAYNKLLYHKQKR